VLPGAPWRRVWEHPAPSSCSPSPATPSQLDLGVLLLQGEGRLQLEVELMVLLEALVITAGHLQPSTPKIPHQSLSTTPLQPRRNRGCATAAPSTAGGQLRWEKHRAQNQPTLSEFRWKKSKAPNAQGLSSLHLHEWKDWGSSFSSALLPRLGDILPPAFQKGSLGSTNPCTMLRPCPEHGKITSRKYHLQ